MNNKDDFKADFKKRLYCWVLRLLKFIDNLPKDSISRTLGNQLIRSGTSILANHTEAQSSSSKKDFSHYFRIALRSANESKVWLALLRDTHRSEEKITNSLLQELQEMAAILASSLITLKGKK